MKYWLAPIAALVAPPAIAAQPDSASFRQAIAEYGACMVKREPERARDFVLAGRSITRLEQREGIFFTQECMPGEKLIRDGLKEQRGSATRARLRFPDVMVRWAIGQALFDRDVAKLATANFAAVPELAYELPYPLRTTTADGDPLPAERIAEQQRRIDEKQGDLALAKLGECVARTDASGSRTALTTAIDSSDELTALKALSPALANCLPAGQTLKFDRMSLRGSLAVAYYRLASAAQSNGAAS